MKFVSILMTLFLSTLFIGCEKTVEVEKSDKRDGNTNVEKPKQKNGNSDEKPKPEEKTSTGENKLAAPKDSIAYQFELVKKGDYNTLKDCCFTDRVKGNLTKEIVDQGQTNASKYTMDDLFASVENGEAEGKKIAKIKMKNGRTLTTLVETNGKWLADTIWFK